MSTIEEPASSNRKIAPLENFLACVHCGLCLSSCPTYLETGRETDSPRGRIYLMKGIEEGRLPLSDSAVRHLDLCLGCRACETACPSGVEYGTLIEGARRLTASAPRGAFEEWKREALARWLPEASRWKPLAPVLRAVSRLGIPRLATASWLPRSLRRAVALVPDAPSARRLRAVMEPTGAPRGTVALLTGCVADALFARINQWTADLLVLAGYRVVVPRRQTCCGALLAHLGERSAARRRARRNVDVFLGGDVDFVVTNAAGCGAMMREYGRLLEDDSDHGDAAERMARKVRDVTELLAASLPPGRHSVAARVVYHDACHLAHGQGVRREPRELLRSVPGLELLELGDGELCCGSAGTYNLTEPEMAWRLGARKAEAVLATGAEMVAAANPGCILQIRAALRLAGRDLPVLHPVEILARSHGLT